MPLLLGASRYRAGDFGCLQRCVVVGHFCPMANAGATSPAVLCSRVAVLVTMPELAVLILHLLLNLCVHVPGLQASSTLETISAGSDMDAGAYSPRRPPLPSVQSSGNLSDPADAQSNAPSVDPSDLGPPSDSGETPHCFPCAFVLTAPPQSVMLAL